MKRALIALLGIFILSAGLSAQTRTSLTIKSNQAGAKVFINGNLVGTADPEFSALLSSDARPYTIKLTKDGYQDFQTTVIIRGDPVTVIATLVPMAQKPPAPNPPGPPTPPAPPPPQSATHFLSIESNVAGAQVFIDGVYYGTTPLSIRLQARRYTLRVTKPGHKDFLKTLELKRSERIYAQVEPLLYSVLIEAANAPGARLYKDSIDMGPLPYRGAWASGNYSIRIESPGYSDYFNFINVEGPLNMRISLVPRSVEYEIMIPEFFATLGGRSLGFENMAVFLDGIRIFSPYGALIPGSHRIEIYIGDIRFESNFEVSFGGRIVIEPFFGIKTR